MRSWVFVASMLVVAITARCIIGAPGPSQPGGPPMVGVRLPPLGHGGATHTPSQPTALPAPTPVPTETPAVPPSEQPERIVRGSVLR